MATIRAWTRAKRAGGGGIIAVVLVLVSTLSLFAHDLWTVPNAIVVAAGGTSEIRGPRAFARAPGDSAAVVAVVRAYHAALESGDSTAALALLATDAIIVESGGSETRDEYRAHHLPGDMAFARAIKAERGAVRVVVQGDVAWATSTSTTQGEYRGRQINSSGAELMVLSRSTTGWMIRAIHWSSRTRRQP